MSDDNVNDQAPGQESEQEPEVVEAGHTHESILHGLMLQLEGMKHMSKSEVEATVDSARAKYETL